MNHNRVRELRRARGVSLRVMARRLGMDPTHLSRLERGTRRCSWELMVAIARFLDLPVEVVFLPEDEEW